MLKNERGRYLQGWELMPKLGFKRGSHLPMEGFETRVVDGVQFRCLPNYHLGIGPKRSRHRILYACTCGLWIPFGRAGQHMKGKVHREMEAEGA